MGKKEKKQILIIFIIILGIKILLSLFIKSPIIYPDESCLILKAKDFIENFKLTNCSDLSNMPAGNPFPLYSILISPIFIFFKGLKAFQVILILNSLLISSLLFPIYGLLKKSISSQKKRLIYTTTLLFLPQVLLYENMLMTETLFLTLSVYFLYFYEKNKNIATILAVLAALTRPFGFILLIAMGISEIINSKRKKQTIFIFTIATILIFPIIQYLLPDILISIQEKLLSIKKTTDLLFVFKAIKNQANSLIIITLLAPIIIFFSEINKIKNKKTKHFLLIFIILNFLVSAQHIYFYFLRGLEQDVLIRYLNVSVFFITLFTFIFLENKEKTKLNYKVFIASLIPIFFLTYQTLNHALNIELSPYYIFFKGFINEDLYFKTIFLPIIAMLAILVLFNKRKILSYSLIVLFLSQTIILYAWQLKYTREEAKNEILNYFEDSNSKILFIDSIKDYKNLNNTNFNYWRLKTFTSNESSSITYNDIKNFNIAPDINSLELANDKDYIITKFDLNLPIILTTKDNEKIYKNENKH